MCLCNFNLQVILLHTVVTALNGGQKKFRKKESGKRGQQEFERVDQIHNSIHVQLYCSFFADIITGDLVSYIFILPFHNYK